MDALSIATLIVTGIRAGHEFAPILAELRGQATPEEWSKIIGDMDTAVDDWRSAPGPDAA